MRGVPRQPYGLISDSWWWQNPGFRSLSVFHISENGFLLLKREGAKARSHLRHKHCNALLHYKQGIREI